MDEGDVVAALGLDLLGESMTGPQTRLWQSASVAKSRTAGLLPTTSAKLTSCIVDGGLRVSMLARSPFALSTVSVSTTGALSPTSGTGPSLVTVSAPPAGVAATMRPSSRARPIRL